MNGFLAVALALLPVQDDKVKSLLRKADECYAQREQAGMSEKALETYQKVLALDESCTEAYWKIARALWSVARNEKDEEKKIRLFREAIDYCKMAIAIDAECTPAHFWLAVSFGLFGEAKGIMQSLDLVEPMKKELEWVVKKDEKFNYAGAHRVLGRLYYKLPGIKGGDNDKAIEHLRRAIELAPDLHDNYLFLAEVYIDEGRKEEAKAALKKILEIKDHPEWGPEGRESQEKARELLKKLKG